MDESPEETKEDTQEAFDFFVKYTYSNECARGLEPGTRNYWTY